MYLKFQRQYSAIAATLLLGVSGCQNGAPDIVIPTHQTENAWYTEGQQAIKSKVAQLPIASEQKAKNVILFLGDGMGISTLTAARILEGQLNGKTGEENYLSFERFPFTGLSKTYNTDQQTPDSAGTMTAMMTGVKTDAGIISIDESVTRGNCQSGQGKELVTALELAELLGRSTGIVSTARITHATPAATYSKSANRNWESDADVPETEKACDDIARQLIEFEDNLKANYPSIRSDGIEVILGGGRRNFLPNDAIYNQENPASNQAEGKRKDNRNLIEEWKTRYPKGIYANDAKSFSNINVQDSSHILGLFNPSHMRYHQDRKNDALGEPSLTQMTSLAIDKLAQNKNGYFLMVEAGRIDHGHHAGNAYNALHDTIELSNAVKAALLKVNLEETLIIVTADHSHVMTISGYPKRGNDILGKVIGTNSTEPTIMKDGLPYTTLGYMNGRGMHDLGDETDADAVDDHPINVGRKDITNIDTTQPGYHQEALIARDSETHGGEDVGIYAVGPGAQLVSGVNEQSIIYHIMTYVSGLSN
jgi:alkaline phosphatase